MLPPWEKDLKRHCETFDKKNWPLAPTIIIINDYEEEVEKKVAKMEVDQLVEVEQLIEFSSKLVQEGFFEVQLDSPNIHVVIPTKMWFKCMMKCKGKETMEEGGSLAKVT
jgi:hypothetical protein